MTFIDIALVATCAALLLLLLLTIQRGKGLDALSHRQEEQTAALARLEGQLQMIGAAQEARLQGLNQATTQALEAVREAVERQLTLALEDARAGRAELATGFAAFRSDIDARLATMTTALREQLEGNGAQLKNQLSIIQETITQQLAGLGLAQQQQAEQMRATLNERLAAIQTDNAAKLEEMRKTVDEKLHATLEQRLGQSFQLVSERLEQVHRGLGEMQTLAAGVGDLKRVLTNVKARGTWGEVQLLTLIDQMLTSEQYGRNVATRPGSAERVEVAIRLPGVSGDRPVWLPIDAKFPVEDYQRLLDAHDRADAEGVEAAARALENRLKAEARTIREKYLEPPFTTDFAVLYLPTEGLYAEALRRPGLAETLQREQRVVLAGPTNLAALLNSLQMGFRTLAIEKRASEVWQVLGQVKTEFGKFGEVIEATKKKLDEARNRFDQVGTRTRAIERKLRDVEALPMPDDALPLALPEED
ncbi:DNA recombination protein RmuC [Sulfuricystis multivorans]|uniref:DNA recombination protein RmuC n=1 Tax=Sulfuricystis multivorans TaxID=2211108 RepID=UPI000F83815D|nr:DNA recombination protein RmuC [Sulfuricystis multivorans]